MMKFYLYMIMLIFLVKFINEMYIIMYMYMMLLLLLFLMIFMNYNNYYMNIYYWLGMDSLSYSLMMLSIFIIALMYFISLNINNKKLFSLLLLLLLLSLMLSFNSMNYFLFYIFFEISLIPTFILVMMFGYQPERLNASMYMMLYTLFASLPLLMILFYLFYEFNSLNYFYINFIKLSYLNHFIFYLYMIFAFLVKLPMFMFHMWLPKAHVEAPISGSMILAGVMLKLGGYGIIRSMNMMLNLCIKYNIIFITLNLIGIMLLSILCLRQNDLKVMVAYSSVVHMSMMLCSLMTLYLYGKISSIFLMIGHGFCSPALFILVNYIYMRSKTRNMFINKGLINLFPSMMLWWFLFCVGNMAAPVTLNLIGELMIMISLMNWSNKILILLILGMFFSAAYSIYLFSIVYHGPSYNSMKYMFNNNIMEYKLMFMLWLPLNMMILKLDMFI